MRFATSAPKRPWEVSSRAAVWYTDSSMWGAKARVVFVTFWRIELVPSAAKASSGGRDALSELS